MPAPLRCHLLIGAPASGKTTLAAVLAKLTGAVVLSTDVVRAEMFGDAAIQGPWRDIEAQMHQRIRESVAAGVPVIVDATHARRPWRLAITQALALPAPVEWIGWWLYTPLATCLLWNQTRQRLVPEAVIREMDAALADPVLGPSRAEGFAALVAVVPTHQQDLGALLGDELARLDQRIRSARNREHRFALHGYSRLLDLERLLYLLRLLSRFPDLAGSDPATAAELEAIVSPLPSGDLADRAAAFLRRLHGDCYGDATALRADLSWLEINGFCSAEPSLGPIQPPPEPAAVLETAAPQANGGSPWVGGMHGGYPPQADAQVFQRVFVLLRHLLQQPFDRQAGTPLPEHLIAQSEMIPGAYLPGEAATLRKDLEKLLTPYGFRSRNDNVRHGYAIGTALLSANRLREIHSLVSQAAGRLADPSAQDLLGELEQRLHWGGIAIDQATPVRAFANRSIVDGSLVRPDSLAAERQAERLETAIVERRRIELERYSSVAAFADSPTTGSFRVWPLQLLFHNIGWYLVFEDDTIGREEGLIRCERLDRLALRHSEGRYRRSEEPHSNALSRLKTLLHHSGGIYFGDNLDAQLELCHGSPQQRAKALVTLRFCCQAWSFAFIREGLQRYPIEHTRFSKRLDGDQWWHHPKAPHLLDPGDPAGSHPYPVELDLPPWTVQSDIDLRNWLFGFGAGIRIESPIELRQEHQQRLQEALAVYRDIHVP